MQRHEYESGLQGPQTLIGLQAKTQTHKDAHIHNIHVQKQQHMNKHKLGTAVLQFCCTYSTHA